MKEHSAPSGDEFLKPMRLPYPHKGFHYIADREGRGEDGCRAGGGVCGGVPAAGRRLLLVQPLHRAGAAHLPGSRCGRLHSPEDDGMPAARV